MPVFDLEKLRSSKYHSKILPIKTVKKNFDVNLLLLKILP